MALATRRDRRSREAYGEVATHPRVRGSHHVFGIEHLLSEFRDSDGTVLLAATSSQRCKANHEEMKMGERNYNTNQLVKR